MVRVIYNGDVNPCNVKVYANLHKNWKTGEIRDLPGACAIKITKDNKNFKMVDMPDKKKPEEKQVEEKKVDYDLNDDGVVDEKDMSIAGKVLASGRKKIKEED